MNNTDKNNLNITGDNLVEGEEISLGIEPKPDAAPERMVGSKHASENNINPSGQIDSKPSQHKPSDHSQAIIGKIHRDYIMQRSRAHEDPKPSLGSARVDNDTISHQPATSQTRKASENSPSHLKTKHPDLHKPKINLMPQPAYKPKEFLVDTKKRRTSSMIRKIRSHKHWYNAKIVVGTVLVFVLLFNSQWFISQIIYLLPKSNTPSPTAPVQPAPPQAPAEAEVVGPKNEIIIPKIGVTAPIIYTNTNNEPDVLVSLRDGVVHYFGTANPGEAGNAVFFGHSSNDWWEAGDYKFIFVLLEKISPGDTYDIHYNSRKYSYLVTETKVVEANDLSVLNQTAEPISTIITCTPPGTSWRRFVVVAKQVAPVAASPPAVSQPQKAAVQSSLPSAAPSIWDQIGSFFGGLFGGNNNPPQSPPEPTTLQRLPEVN